MEKENLTRRSNNRTVQYFIVGKEMKQSELNENIWKRRERTDRTERRNKQIGRELMKEDSEVV